MQPDTLAWAIGCWLFLVKCCIGSRKADLHATCTSLSYVNAYATVAADWDNEGESDLENDEGNLHPSRRCALALLTVAVSHPVVLKSALGVG